MAKRVIVLNRVKDAPGVTFRVALWAVVPAARQRFYANASETSAWLDAAAGEIMALQNGSVVEQVETIQWPTGTAIATIQADLAARWTAWQAEVNVNLYDRYGTFNDSVTGWTAGGVS